MSKAKKENSLILESYQINRTLPSNYKEGELDFCKNEFSYQTYDVKLMHYKNPIVNYKGFLYDTNFSIVTDSLVFEPHYKGVFTKKHFFKKVFFKEKISLREKCLLTFDEWGHNHYHWFCDTLPRIYAVKEQLENYVLLLPDFPYVRDIGLQTLKLLALKPKDIYFISPKELIKPRELTLVTHVTLSGYINDFILSAISNELKDAFKNLEPKRKRKLYISRQNAGYRKVLNEDEVIQTVKKFNYEVVSYENMSLQEQIILTSSCASMVSIHGAGLTNMIYMPKGASVLEFRRDKIYHNQCYWHLADAVGLKYYYLFGTPDEENLVIEGDGCNLTINVAKLTTTLEQIELTLDHSAP